MRARNILLLLPAMTLAAAAAWTCTRNPYQTLMTTPGVTAPEGWVSSRTIEGIALGQRMSEARRHLTDAGYRIKDEIVTNGFPSPSALAVMRSLPAHKATPYWRGFHALAKAYNPKIISISLYSDLTSAGDPLVGRITIRYKQRPRPYPYGKSYYYLGYDRELKSARYISSSYDNISAGTERITLACGLSDNGDWGAYGSGSKKGFNVCNHTYVNNPPYMTVTETYPYNINLFSR